MFIMLVSIPVYLRRYKKYSTCHPFYDCKKDGLSLRNSTQVVVTSKYIFYFCV